MSRISKYGWITKLNDDKTEFIVFKSKRNVNTSFAEQNVQQENKKYRGDIWLDDINASTCEHYCQKMFEKFAISSEEERRIIVHTFVISKLDYCNAPMLYYTPWFPLELRVSLIHSHSLTHTLIDQF